MVSRFEGVRSRLLTCVLACLLVPALASAVTAHKSSTAKKTTRKSRSSHARYVSRIRGHIPLRRSPHRRTLARSRHRHSHSAASKRWHMPGFEIAPQRTNEIQQALVSAGDLHEQPTGHWDAQTRDAMRLYQHQNGFQPTGLPDAKSLMKMGLGPHPLPPQLDPLAQQARSGYADSSAGSSYGQPLTNH